MTPEQLLARLNEQHISTLCELWVDYLMSLPVASLVPEARALAFAQSALDGWLSSDTALAVFQRELQALQTHLNGSSLPLDEMLPPQILGALEQLVERIPSPNKEAVLAMLDRAPVRKLFRKLLLDALLDFGRALRSPVEGVTKGISGFAKFAADRAGALGSFMGALGSEVEKQFEKRAADFADAALSSLLQKLVEELSNPARAKEQVELRVAIFEGLLTLKGFHWGKELQKADVTGSAQLLRRALSSWLTSGDGQATLSKFLSGVWRRHGQQTSQQLLSELGLYAPLKTHLGAALVPHVQSALSTDAFHDWLADLLRENEPCT